MEATGGANSGETSGLTSTGTGLANLKAAVQCFGQVRSRTELFFRSKPGPLAGYLDLLLILVKCAYSCVFWMVLSFSSVKFKAKFPFIFLRAGSFRQLLLIAIHMYPTSFPRLANEYLLFLKPLHCTTCLMGCLMTRSVGSSAWVGGSRSWPRMLTSTSSDSWNHCK